MVSMMSSKRSCLVLNLSESPQLLQSIRCKARVRASVNPARPACFSTERWMVPPGNQVTQIAGVRSYLESVGCVMLVSPNRRFRETRQASGHRHAHLATSWQFVVFFVGFGSYTTFKRRRKPPPEEKTVALQQKAQDGDRRQLALSELDPSLRTVPFHTTHQDATEVPTRGRQREYRLGLSAHVTLGGRWVI